MVALLTTLEAEKEWLSHSQECSRVCTTGAEAAWQCFSKHLNRASPPSHHLNLKLYTFVDDEDTFKDADPLLFGKSFNHNVRDHIEAIKSLKK